MSPKKTPTMEHDPHKFLRVAMCQHCGELQISIHTDGQRVACALSHTDAIDLTLKLHTLIHLFAENDPDTAPLVMACLCDGTGQLPN